LAVAVDVLGRHAHTLDVALHLGDEAALVHTDGDLHARHLHLEVAEVDGDLQAGPFLRRAGRQRDRRDSQQEDRVPPLRHGQWPPTVVPPMTISLLVPGRVPTYVAAPAPTAAAPTSVQNHHFWYQRCGSRRSSIGIATCNRKGNVG